LTKVMRMPCDHILGRFNEGEGYFSKPRNVHPKNEEQIWFWEDKWLWNQPFMTHYPTLYQIVRQRSATVATVLGTIPLNVSFRKALIGPNLIL
jgi:hypothetical protein